VRLADGVAGRLRQHGTGARTLSLKVRFAGFHTITRAVTVPTAVHTAHAIVQAVDPLLDAVDPSPGVRLLGVSATNFGTPAEQLSLDDLFAGAADGPVAATAHEWEAAEETIDAIRSRFGAAAIGPASAVGGRGLRLVRKGAQQWGPDQQPPAPVE
jgi:DNA polymerase-4